MSKKKAIILSILASPIIAYLIIFYIIPSFIQVQIPNLPESTKVYDQNWVLIWKSISQDRYRHTYKELDEFPEFLIDATVVLEDKRFWSNNWIDELALIRASYQNIKNLSIRQWWSTISSQLIRNTKRLNEPRTFRKKFKEFLLAVSLNRQYQKEEILEKYMNSINFGYMNFGFESAAQFYFGRSVNNLTKAQQIALLTIPKNANRFDPIRHNLNFQKRYELLSKYFYENWILSEQDYIFVKNENLEFRNFDSNNLPYIQDFLDNKREISKWNTRIWMMPLAQNQAKISSWSEQTTIDYYLTQKAQEIWDRNIQDLAWKNVWDYGILIVERDNNDIKVMIGGTDYYGERWQVNSVLAQRQVWSTIKPFTYLLWFKNHWYTPFDSIQDLPVLYKTNLWFSYEPQNFDLDFKWEVSIAESLAQSLNVPAIRMTNKIWAENLLWFLQSLWISSLTRSAEYYWLALWLWAGDMSLYELLRAYTIFANDGQLCDFNIIKWEEKYCENIIEKNYIDDIVHILSNRYYKLRSFPLYSSTDFPDRFVFKKTWTSRNFVDNHILWFTENYLIWVWVGNKSWEVMQWVRWATWAGSIFNELVYLLEDEEFKPVAENIQMQSQDFVQITSPLDGSVFKLNPHRPLEYQKTSLMYETNQDYTQSQWLLNWQVYHEDLVWVDLWEWKYTLELQLFDETWNLIKSDISKFEIKED